MLPSLLLQRSQLVSSRTRVQAFCEQNVEAMLQFLAARAVAKAAVGGAGRRARPPADFAAQDQRAQCKAIVFALYSVTDFR